MACCALAAFLVSQLIFGLDWLRERAGFGAPALAPNAAASWRPGAPVFVPPNRLVARTKLALAGGGVAFAALVAMGLWTGAGQSTLSRFQLICTGHGLVLIAANGETSPGVRLAYESRRGETP